jgi:DNA primase
LPVQDITSKIDVEHFLLGLGIEFEKPKNREVNFHCPFPGHSNGDMTPSAYMNKDTTAFFCHGCHKGGNAISFASEVLDISRLKAIQFLREKYDPGYFQSGGTSTSDEVRRILTSKQQPPEERQKVIHEEALEAFRTYWDIEAPWVDYMLGRGFSEETLEEWDIGYDSDTDRITIPVRDERNDLIGFKARVYDNRKKPKYIVLGDNSGDDGYYGFSTYLTGKVVFGLPQAILAEDSHLEDKHRHFVVCEGELNAIALWQAGYAGIAINGSNLTKYQIETIRREADRLTLYFDNDEAGKRALNASHEAFSDHMPTQVVISDKDAADSTPEEIAYNIENADGLVHYVLSS